MRINEFHLRAMAAAGDLDAINIVTGLDILGWNNIDKYADGPDLETDFVPVPDDAVLVRLRQLGWSAEMFSYDRDCYFIYPLPEGSPFVT